MKTFSLVCLAAAAVASARAETDCAGPLICPAICAPTCASDGRTYSSSCQLTWARDCKDSSIVQVSTGVCPGDTAWNSAKCDSDPQESGSAGSSSRGSSGSGDGKNSSSTPTPDTPTVTSPANTPVPAPSNGAARSGLVMVPTAVAVVAVGAMVL